MDELLMISELQRFETETYPRLWHAAYDAGAKAKKNGLPRNCNLEGSSYCHNGNVLKVYKSAWEQGWDGYKMPIEFLQMEAYLRGLPLHPMKMEDI